MLAVGRGSVKSVVQSLLGGSCSGWRDGNVAELQFNQEHKGSGSLPFTSSLILDDTTVLQ